MLIVYNICPLPRWLDTTIVAFRFSTARQEIHLVWWNYAEVFVLVVFFDKIHDCISFTLNLHPRISEFILIVIRRPCTFQLNPAFSSSPFGAPTSMKATQLEFWLECIDRRRPLYIAFEIKLTIGTGIRSEDQWINDFVSSRTYCHIHYVSRKKSPVLLNIWPK